MRTIDRKRPGASGCDLRERHHGVRSQSPLDRCEFREALESPVGTYSARPETPAPARSAEATTLDVGLLLSALRAVAVCCGRSEYGSTATDRAFRLAEDSWED